MVVSARNTAKNRLSQGTSRKAELPTKQSKPAILAPAIPLAVSALSPSSRALYAEMAGMVPDLLPLDERVLVHALAALDRADQARAELGTQPLTVVNRWGDARPNPLIQIERAARTQYAAMVKQLGIHQPETKKAPIAAYGRHTL